MAFAAGSYHGLSYIEEVEFGVTPGGTKTALRHTGCGLAINKDSFQSNELRSDRQIADFRHGVIRAQGDIPIELSYTEFDSLLEGALFNNWNGDELKAGVVRKSYTFVRRFSDIYVDGTFTGCMVNDFSLSIPANAMVTGSFGLIGKEGSYDGTEVVVTLTVTGGVSEDDDGDVTFNVAGSDRVVAVTEGDVNHVAGEIRTALDSIEGIETGGADAEVTVTFKAVNGNGTITYTDTDATGAAVTVSQPALPTVTASQTYSPFDSFTGELKEGGNTIATITSIDINLDNNLEPVFVVGANTTPRIVPGRSNLTGTVSCYFENMTMLDKFINETESEIEFTLEDSAGNEYEFKIPRIKYSGGDNPVNAEGPIVLNMPFQALYNADDDTNLIITKSDG